MTYDKKKYQPLCLLPPLLFDTKVNVTSHYVSLSSSLAHHNGLYH